MEHFDRFARFYDLDTADYREDIALYRDFARRCGSPVLEVACGTGRVLVPLAEAGFRVTGIDISPAMLAIAADKAASAGVTSRVNLVQADARSFQLPERFAFAFIALNSFMLFVTLEDQLRVLDRIAAHLRPGGMLVLDLFNPDLAQLLEAHGAVTLDYTKTSPAGGGTVSKFSANYADPADQQIDVTFVYDELAADGSVKRTVAPFSMHYFWPRELALLLDKAGYRIEQSYGSYDLAEFAADSPRLIVVAAKRDLE